MEWNQWVNAGWPAQGNQWMNQINGIDLMNGLFAAEELLSSLFFSLFNQQSTLSSLQSKKLIEWREESWVDFISFSIAGYEPEAPLAQLHSIPFNSFKLNSISAALLHFL